MLLRAISTVIVFCFVSLYSGIFIAGADTQKIRVGVVDVKGASATQWIIAKELGLAQKHGLTIELIQINIGVGIYALLNNNLDYLSTLESAVVAIVNGAPLKIVAGTMIRSPHALVSSKEIGSVRALENKTVGINKSIDGGDGLDTVTKMILDRYGVDLKKINFISMPSNAYRVTALHQSIIQATMLPPLASLQMKNSGFTILAQASQLFDFPLNALTTPTNKIQNNRPQVQKVIAVLLEAARIINENPSYMKKFLSKFMDISEKDAEFIYQGAIKNIYSTDGIIPENSWPIIFQHIKKRIGVDHIPNKDEIVDYSMLPGYLPNTAK